jgi:CP family cyanate transporter-like MFS transporter
MNRRGPGPRGGPPLSGQRRPLAGRWPLLCALVAVGLNLRGPIVAVAPVLDEIRRDLRISETEAGLLTAVPVLCFAAVSPFVAGVARRIGSNATVAVSLALLAVGIAVRPWGGFALMLAATVLLGVAIAGNNVLLPAIARRDFPDRAGPVMSAATTSLLVSATIPAFLTVPLATAIGWRAALAIWAVMVVAALALWWRAVELTADQAGGAGDGGGGPPGAAVAPVPSAWRAPAAWVLGLFFGVQALLFYATTAWLPTMLQAEGGLDAAAAGTALSLFQLLGIASAIAVPMLVRGRYLRYAVAVAQAALWVGMFAGLLAAPSGWPLWCALGGLGQGGGIALGLSMIAMRSSGGEVARSVSAMVQTVGYCLGAVGPVLIGAVSAATTGWTVPLLLLMALSVLLGGLGARSAVPSHIR